MARYTGPVCRLCRRAGEKLLLKGERCFTPRCAVDRRRTVPGEHASRRRRLSDHGLQLKEKQKARHTYGLMEGQFRLYMEEAFRRPSATGPYLLLLLETRLDNVVYRLGFADSRRQARQLVCHGHFKVRGRKTDIPSYHVRPEDLISWKESEMQRDYVKVLTRDLPKRPIPEWLDLDVSNLTARVLRLPREDELESNFDPRLIVEFYSR